MGQFVFSRLFYHHMAGQLAGQKEFKNRLFTYLEGTVCLFVTVSNIQEPLYIYFYHITTITLLLK